MGGEGVRVLVAGASDKEVFGIVDGGLDMRKEEIIIIRKAVEGDTMDDELEISWGKPKGEPGAVAHWEGLIGLKGESIEEKKGR